MDNKFIEPGKDGKIMLESARSSEKEIPTKKRWKTSTLLIFIFSLSFK